MRHNPNILRALLLWMLSTVAASAQNSPLSILTTSLPVGAVNVAYSFAVTATGGSAPYSWSADGLPGGFSLNSGSGLLTGTPTVAGNYDIVLHVKDQTQATASKSLTLAVNAQSPSFTTASPLPVGTVGLAYSLTFGISGGLPPYRLSIPDASGFPPGLALNLTTGALSGVPTAKGSFSFTLQVTDSAGHTASKIFAITINTLPLTISTNALFNATVGLPYSQAFSASGGTPPYKWSISSGQIAGLTMDATGLLSGTPGTAGSFKFTVQVADSAAVTSSQDFTLIVNPAQLTILTTSPLPAATVGTAYSQKFAVAGGTQPYTWSITTSPVPGLSMDAATGTLSGTPATAGSFNLAIQVKDSASQTGSKLFILTVNPGPLIITTALQLPAGTFGQPFSQPLSASGGAPPYTWSALGLPDGLQIDAAAGMISGVPQTGGSFSFAITATDSARTTATARFLLTIGMPAIPPVTITGLSSTANPADQPTIQLQLASPYPAPVVAQLNLTFTSDAGGNDSSIQFATGGRTASVTIPAGNTVPDGTLAIQTGTVAGTIQITATQFTSYGVDVTPAPAPVQSTRIKPAPPAIVSANVVRNANGFSIQVIGYATSREVTQAVFHFTATGGSTLQTGDLTVPVQSIFSQWFQDSASVAYGSQFMFTQQFTVQGDPNAVIPGSVTLTNSLGMGNTSTVSP
jgi:hypothetical protein